MAKKVSLDEFDESTILSVMGGPASPARVGQPAQKQSEQAEAAPEAPEASEASKEAAPPEPAAAPAAESEKSTPAKRKKRTYEEVFLPVRNIGSLRKPITLSPETHNRLDAIVRIALDGRISLSNYVDNILLHHIDEYNDELKALWNSHVNRAF
jgi:pyruvate/2-oxoglutarate dehydrogenase complex dihydrolipoamide acyltransferase (E2) component